MIRNTADDQLARIVSVAVVSLIVWAYPCAAAPEVTFDRWYAVLLQGQLAGWLHTNEMQKDQQITSQAQMHLEIRRGASVPKIKINSQFVETTNGEPIRSELVRNLGLFETKQTVVYTEDQIEMTIEQAGQTQQNVYPRSTQTWMPPAAASRYIEQQVGQGAQEIQYWMVDPMGGIEPFEARMIMRGRENTEVRGKVVPATVWDMSTSQLPGIVSRVYTDEKGRDLKSTLAVIPGLSFEVVEADEQIARSQIDPVEILVSTFIRPDRPITDPRHQRSVIYELRFSDLPSSGAAGPDRSVPPYPLTRTGYQRVVWNDALTAAVVVSLDDPVPPGEDLPGDVHRRTSFVLNHKDPKIRELVSDALTGGTDIGAADKAEHLRKYVRDYVHSKDLRVGFATASEVARTAEGDCTEHAVLLAAMLRAEGIPSRTVSGLIYVDHAFLGKKDIFGYHMWTQAWLPAEVDDGRSAFRWVDLDPTRKTPFDAAHITLSVGAMDDKNLINDIVKVAPVLGRLSIKVIETH